MIICFSGKETNLQIAKLIAKRNSDKIVSIRKVKNDNSKHVIFVFPTTMYNIPRSVQNFIKRFCVAPGQKVIGVSISSGRTGNSQFTFYNLIQQKGISVEKFLQIDKNSIQIKSENSSKKILDKGVLQNLIDDFWLIEKSPKVTYNPLTTICESLFNYDKSTVLFRKKVDASKCNGCDICVNNCPTNNILKLNEKIIFGNHCAGCGNCIDFCSLGAISVRRNVLHPASYSAVTKRVKVVK